MIRSILPVMACVLLSLPLFSIAQQAAKTKEGKSFASNTNALDMRGAYQMLRQVANDGTKDSLMNTEQLKIYTDRHMIYVHPASGDSLAEYGIATYRIENGKVIENVFYTSADGPVNQRFELDINKSADGFTQVVNIPDQANNKNWLLTEDYRRVDKNMTTPLDGAWKQTKRLAVAKDGTTRTMDSPTQFKVFHQGNFIWVNTFKDSASGKPISFYGYGNFKMNGKNQIVENNTSSSFKSALVGRPVTVQVKLVDKNHFEQTIAWPDGSKETEVYERL